MKLITSLFLTGVVAAALPREVQVEFPRFKTTSSFALKKTLSGMGMPRAFLGGTADFTGISGSKLFFLSDVYHKAFVDVNEVGTEAAAATAVVGEDSEAEPARPVPFIADHPFVFLIRDVRSGAILFLGRVTNPM